METEQTELNWVQQMDVISRQMSVDFQTIFNKAIKDTVAVIPKTGDEAQDQEHLAGMITTLVDYATNTGVGLAIKFINNSEDFEDLVVSGVREQFKTARAKTSALTIAN
jgi:hypothetical protein